MEFTLKPLPGGGGARGRKGRAVSAAHEPAEAASICLDALAIEPNNHDALVNLLLALTEQFEEDLPGVIAEASRWSIG